MMMKSGLGKIFLKFLHALTMSFLLLNFDQKYKFSNKNNVVSAWRNFKKNFLKPIFFKKPCFLFFVIIFSYIAHCVNLVAAQLLNICLIAEAELHS